MSSAAHDPRLLYSINNIRAFHIQHGEESELTPSGPQTLSLLMVPTSAIPINNATVPDSTPEEDFYLHLHLPPELDLALPATTQIYHQPPHSYLVPRWDLGPDAGAFIRIQFPGIGSGSDKVTQEDVDTFETILAQCTAFLERAPPPTGHSPYNPADYAPGEGYVSSSNARPGQHGTIVLVDEENGSVVGEMEGYDVVENADVKPGSKTPVEIQLPGEGEGNQVAVSSVSEEYLAMSRHPAYKDSTIVQTSATASRLVVTGTSYIANVLTSGADSFIKKTQPNPKPMTFSDTAHDRIRKIGNFTQGAKGFSGKTADQVNKYAQNFGASMSRREQDAQRKSPGYKPGVLNKSMIAFSTLADGIEQGAKNLLTSSSTAATTMIGHRYGTEAGSVASNVTGGFTNVGLVYIDAAGVNRKALIKSVAKGMVVGRMRDGKQVVVGTGDGGDVPGIPSPPGNNGALSGQDPVVGRPSPHPTPPPAYSASGMRLQGGPTMTGGKQ